MSEHTKEPWILVETEDDTIEITTENRNGLFVPIAEVSTWFDGQIGIEQEANARRIVVCVNACAGISTIDLEMDNAKFIDALKKLSGLKQQRDELLAVLLDIVNDAQDITKPAYQRALAVIASCESAKA